MALEFDFDFERQLEQVAKVPKPVRLTIAVLVLASVAAGYWFVSYEPKAEQVQLLQVKIQKEFKTTPIYREISQDPDEGYHMGVYLCLGQEPHGLSHDDAVPYRDLGSFEKIHEYMEEKVF